MKRVWTSRKNTKTVLAIAATGAMTAAMMAAPPTASGMSAGEAFSGFDGPRGVAMGPGGKIVVTEANGTFSKVVRSGPNRGKIVKIGKVPNLGIAPAVDINNKGQIFVLTGLGEREGAATLYRYTPGKGRQMIADIGRYQKSDPDPFDLEKKPKESNPYGVAALNDGGALVADAAGNDLLRVKPNGKIITVARVKPRTVKSPDLGPDGPPPGTKMPTEAVITSVTVGKDGSYYIGELRGFPGTPGKSEIWRIKPGTRNAVCNPKRPNRGDCKRHADGLTSIVDLAAGPNGSIYAVELSKMSWLALESEPPTPGSEVGALIKVAHDTSVHREVAKGKLIIPGGVEVGRRGGVFVTTPMFGPGRLLRVK
jgi:hypothetical protein